MLFYIHHREHDKRKQRRFEYLLKAFFIFPDKWAGLFFVLSFGYRHQVASGQKGILFFWFYRQGRLKQKALSALFYLKNTCYCMNPNL
jgi:hypothetical protein